MDIVKVNLTKEKVNKLIDRAESTDLVPPFIIDDNAEVMKSVMEALVNKLEVSKVVVEPRKLVAANFGSAKTISTFFIDKGWKTVWSPKIEGATMSLCWNAEHNAVELWWLEVQSKNSGRGTELLNTLLDVIDELGLNLYLTPVPFSPGGKVKTNAELSNAFFRLRNWYLSFDGFEKIGNWTPSLIYKTK